MLDPRTSFMTGLLKSREAGLVGRDHLFRLAAPGRAQARDTDARAALGDTAIGAWLEGERWRGAVERDRCLWRYLEETFTRLEHHPFFPPDARRFVGAYRVRYDVANLKAILQGLALAREPRLVPVGRVQAAGRLEALAEAAGPEEVAAVLRASGLPWFAALVGRFKPDGSDRARLGVEARLEGEYYRELLDTARGLAGSAVLTAACGTMVDLANLAILCRLAIAGADRAEADHFVPGGYLINRQEIQDALIHGLEDLPRRLHHELHRRVAAEAIAAYQRGGSVAWIERVIERERLAALRGLLASSPAPAAVMAWFLVLKEIEVRNVRLGLTGMEEGMGFDQVRGQLLA